MLHRAFPPERGRSQVALCDKFDMVHDHRKDMAVLVRKSATRPEVKIVYDASHPTSRYFDFENDPSVSRDEKVIWVMFAEVSLGYKNYEKTQKEHPATDAALAAEQAPDAAPAAGSSSKPEEDTSTVYTYSGEKV